MSAICAIYVAIVCRVPLPNNCAISYIICYAVYLYDPVPVIIPLASIGITIREGKCVYLKNTYHESKNHQNCQKDVFSLNRTSLFISITTPLTGA